MAATVTINYSDFDYNIERNQKRARGTAVLDSAYVTGGEPVDFTDTAIMTGAGGAFTTVHEVTVSNSSALAANAGYVATYDLTNSKFIMFEAGTDSNPLDQVGSGDNLSAVTLSFQVTGV